MDMKCKIIVFLGVLFLFSGCIGEEEPKLIFRGEDAFRGNVAHEVESPQVIANADLEMGLLDGYEEGSLEEEPSEMRVLPLPASVLMVPEIKKVSEKPAIEKRVIDSVYDPEEGYIERTNFPPRREGYLENVGC